MARSRVTKKDLQTMTDRLNELEGRPTASHTKLDKPDEYGRTFKNNPGHIILDHAACYGGYALREQMESGEGFYYPRWRRISAREMYEFLQGKLYELDN